jgi:hypothetical protein
MVLEFPAALTASSSFGNQAWWPRYTEMHVASFFLLIRFYGLCEFLEIFCSQQQSRLRVLCIRADGCCDSAREGYDANVEPITAELIAQQNYLLVTEEILPRRFARSK